MDYIIHLATQLREHLRALRKERGLTQAALGHLLGIGQARVAEIESNPGVVSVDQLMRVLSALQTTLVLRAGGEAAETGPPKDKAPPESPTLHEPPPGADLTPDPERPFSIRPKKGSW